MFNDFYIIILWCVTLRNALFHSTISFHCFVCSHRYCLKLDYLVILSLCYDFFSVNLDNILVSAVFVISDNREIPKFNIEIKFLNFLT